MAGKAVERLRATFESAQTSGLSDEQVWQSVVEVARQTPPETPAENCLDEVAAILADRIEEERYAASTYKSEAAC